MGAKASWWVAAAIAVAMGTSGRAARAGKAATFEIAGVGLATVVSAVEIHDNPAEPDPVDVPWKAKEGRRSDSPIPEFTAGEPYRVEFELLFDGVEEDGGAAEAAAQLQEIVSENGDDPTQGPDVFVSWNGRDWRSTLLAAKTTLLGGTANDPPTAVLAETTWSEFVEVAQSPRDAASIPIVVESDDEKVPASLNVNSIRLLTIRPNGTVKARALRFDPKWGLSRSAFFDEGDPHRLDLTLFLDTFEQKTDVSELAHVLESFADEESEHRPTRVKVIFGGGLPAFEGVIESVGTKYTMFLENGTPVRATCRVKMK